MQEQITFEHCSLLKNCFFQDHTTVSQREHRKEFCPLKKH